MSINRFKAKKKIPIKYTHRDFDSIKRDLLEIAQRDYSNTYRDFNESSFGSMMFDMVAYVGDILSFYLDYQTNESFMDTAIEYSNVIKHGKEKGYKFRINQTSFGYVTMYVKVPANSTGVAPDSRYIPYILKGSSFATTNGNNFLLNENIDFADSNNEVVVATVDEDSGIPITYAIKAKGKVISGEIIEEFVEIGNFERFLRIKLSGENISEILQVFDSEGNEYFEVEYLSQNVIYKKILNQGENKESVPSILKPVIIARRFIFEQERDGSYIQFGYGSKEEIKVNSVSDPSNVVLDIHGKDYITDSSFDPNKLMQSDKFGIAPSNTTLRVIYRENTQENVNASTDSLVESVSPIFKFKNSSELQDNIKGEIIESLEITNEEPIIGDITYPSSIELKKRIFDNFASQNRSVTSLDYINTIYNMPSEFGAIKRANVRQDNNSFKRNLNIYIISENFDGSLVQCNDLIKQNLRTWILKNKMINDTVDILDAYIVNLSINFEAISEFSENKFDILSNAVLKLREYYIEHFDIGEPFNISDVYNVLKTIDGLVDVTNVIVEQKIGSNYSNVIFDINKYTSSDGRMIYCPENMIFEVKFPGSDIFGSIK